MRLGLLVLALLVASPGQTRAAEVTAAATSPAFSACMDRSGGVTVAMRDCYAAETQQQDRRLNTVYRQITRDIEAPARTKLLRAQRAWLAYRKAECELAMTPHEGGTLALVTGDDCWLRLTAERVRQLEQHRDAFGAQ